MLLLNHIQSSLSLSRIVKYFKVWVATLRVPQLKISRKSFFALCTNHIYVLGFFTHITHVCVCNRTFATHDTIDSVQGVKSLGGHFVCLCRGFDFYEVKKNIIIFKKEKGNTFTLLIIFIVKSLQKEQNSTNLLLWTPICRNKRAITPKWINS